MMTTFKDISVGEIFEGVFGVKFMKIETLFQKVVEDGEEYFLERNEVVIRGKQPGNSGFFPDALKIKRCT